jgi:hypothetical protein
MLPHRDPGHVLAIQLEGVRHSVIEMSKTRHVVGHDVPGYSIHIAITLEEPTTRELADVVLADSLATQAAAALEGEYLRYGPSEAAERTRDVLRRFLAEGTRGTEALIEDAARLKTHVPPDPER